MIAKSGTEPSRPTLVVWSGDEKQGALRTVQVRRETWDVRCFIIFILLYMLKVYTEIYLLAAHSVKFNACLQNIRTRAHMHAYAQTHARTHTHHI